MKRVGVGFLTLLLLLPFIITLKIAWGSRQEAMSTSPEIPPTVRSRVKRPILLEANPRLQTLLLHLVSFSHFSSTSPASLQNPENQIYTAASASPSRFFFPPPRLSLHSLSLVLPTWTRAMASCTSGQRWRQRPTSSNTSSAATVAALPCLPLTSVSSSSSSPPLSPLPVRGSGRRDAAAAPTGGAPAWVGPHGPLPLPHPPHVDSSTPPPTRERVLLWLSKP